MTHPLAATASPTPGLRILRPRAPRRRPRFAPLDFFHTCRQAWRCEAYYRNLAALSDQSLERLGIARAEIPRLAARLSGLLPDEPAFGPTDDLGSLRRQLSA